VDESISQLTLHSHSDCCEQELSAGAVVVWTRKDSDTVNSDSVGEFFWTRSNNLVSSGCASESRTGAFGATIAMTLDIYSHVLPSMQQEAADKIDDMFRRS